MAVAFEDQENRGPQRNHEPRENWLWFLNEQKDIMPIEDVILTTENCRYCLMCRHIAPVEKVTYKETLSPHGWALIIASVRRGLLAWDEDTVDAVYSAPDGGNSRAHCVTNQPLPEAIAAARAEIAQQGLAPAVCYEINTALEKWGTPFAQPSPEASRGQGEVALFIGDEAEYLWPETIPAVLKLLNACGIEPVLIGNGRSNGFLASSLGFPETAKNIAQANLDDLEASGAKRLLVLSPGDYFAFSQLYDERLGLPWPEEVKLLMRMWIRLTRSECRLGMTRPEICWRGSCPAKAVSCFGDVNALILWEAPLCNSPSQTSAKN
jgi:Fe-S oxidoreductase